MVSTSSDPRFSNGSFTVMMAPVGSRWTNPGKSVGLSITFCTAIWAMTLCLVISIQSTYAVKPFAQPHQLCSGSALPGLHTTPAYLLYPVSGCRCGLPTVTSPTSGVVWVTGSTTKVNDSRGPVNNSCTDGPRKLSEYLNRKVRS